jgi:hypothetical protein
MKPSCDHTWPDRELRYTCLLCKQPLQFGEPYSCGKGGCVVHNDCLALIPSLTDLTWWQRGVAWLLGKVAVKFVARFGLPWTTVVEVEVEDDKDKS